tara:strand:- start:272 stop:532 length:261 start_codon:yes stop_codon:yes gene_type:complete
VRISFELNFSTWLPKVCGLFGNTSSTFLSQICQNFDVVEYKFSLWHDRFQLENEHIWNPTLTPSLEIAKSDDGLDISQPYFPFRFF